MTRGKRPGLGAYARALEQALSRIRGRPIVLSPRDWTLASEWYGREVPLAMVLEVLEEAADRSRRRGGQASGPRSLAYVSAAVEEAWALVRAGRADRVTRVSSRMPSLARSRQAWETAAARLGEEAPLGRTLQGLLERFGQGAHPADLDRALDEQLLTSAAPSEVSRARREVATELEPFRSRMSAAAFEATWRRAVVEHLRRTLRLPRLGLADPGS